MLRFWDNVWYLSVKLVNKHLLDNVTTLIHLCSCHYVFWDTLIWRKLLSQSEGKITTAANSETFLLQLETTMNISKKNLPQIWEKTDEYLIRFLQSRVLRLGSLLVELIDLKFLCTLEPLTCYQITRHLLIFGADYSTERVSCISRTWRAPSVSHLTLDYDAGN